jgi:hypothetical protein
LKDIKEDKNLDKEDAVAKKVFQDVFISSMATEPCVEQKKCKVEKSLSDEGITQLVY